MFFKSHEEYFKSIIFGIEDALVSTTGVVVGISAGIQDRQVILLASLVSILVAAISLSAGEFISEEAIEELDKKKKKGENVFFSSSIIFVSYLLAGLIPVLPIMFLPFPLSLIVSIGFSLVGLYTLGYLKGKIVGISTQKSAFKVLIIGGLATVFGIIAGYFLKV